MKQSRIFQALADPYRLRIIELLRNADIELCLCDFSESLGEPDYKLSRHLKVLKESGLISAKRDGKWIYHSLESGAPAYKHLFLFLANMAPSKDSSGDFARFRKMLKSRDGGKCQRIGSARKASTP